MSPFLIVIAVAIFIYYLYRYCYITPHPSNFPPGPPRLPIFDSYLSILWEDYWCTYKAFYKMTHYYRSKVIGFYVAKTPSIVACSYETVKEALFKPEFQGRMENIVTQIRSNNKRLGIMFTEPDLWIEQKRFMLRHLRDFGFARRYQPNEEFMKEVVHNMVTLLQGACTLKDKEVFRDGEAKLPNLFFSATVNCLWTLFAEDQLLMIGIDMVFPTASTLPSMITFTILLLTQHPEIQEKVQNEIDTVVGRHRLPSLDDRAKLPYMEAVIREALRKVTIIPLSLVKKCTEDTYFQGYFIPKGTMVVPNLWAAHMDPEFWGDPENFRPDRFLDERGLKKDLTLAFGGGKRVCAGETFSRHLTFLFLSGLLQNFTFAAPEDSPLPDLDDLVNGVSLSVKDFWIKVVPRD